MKIAILICSYIPKDNKDILQILRNNIQEIQEQISLASAQYATVLLDDGSDYIQNISKPKSKNIIQLDTGSTKTVNDSLSVDKGLEYIFHAPFIEDEKEFRKCELIRHSSKILIDEGFTHLIVLDDDHVFQVQNALNLFEKHFLNNYDFVLGRILTNKDYYRSYFDNLVQGTTYGISLRLFEKVDFISLDPIKWGGGEDSELFYRLYLEKKKSNFKAIFDGNIITLDSLSGRWLPCFETKGSEEEFIKGFKLKYGVSPHFNNSRNKSLWLEQANDPRGPEIKFIFLKSEEFESFTDGDFHQFMVDLRQLYTLYRYIFKGNKVKVKITKGLAKIAKKMFDLYYRAKKPISPP